MQTIYFPHMLRPSEAHLTLTPYMCVCMYVCTYEGRAASDPCTATIIDLLCFPFGLTLYQSRTSKELQDFAYGGVIIVIWLHK
jgi:hypothetical protein